MEGTREVERERRGREDRKTEPGARFGVVGCREKRKERVTKEEE